MRRFTALSSTMRTLTDCVSTAGAAVACSDATSAAAGLTATTTIGTRFVTPLALTDRNDDAVVDAL